MFGIKSSTQSLSPAMPGEVGLPGVHRPKCIPTEFTSGRSMATDMSGAHRCGLLVCSLSTGSGATMFGERAVERGAATVPAHTRTVDAGLHAEHRRLRLSGQSEQVPRTPHSPWSFAPMSSDRHLSRGIEMRWLIVDPSGARRSGAFARTATAAALVCLKRLVDGNFQCVSEALGGHVGQRHDLPGFEARDMSTAEPGAAGNFWQQHAAAHPPITEAKLFGREVDNVLDADSESSTDQGELVDLRRLRAVLPVLQRRHTDTGKASDFGTGTQIGVRMLFARTSKTRRVKAPRDPPGHRVRPCRSISRHCAAPPG